MDIILQSNLYNFNWVAFGLLLICLFGIYEHWRAYSETLSDVEAMIAAGRNSYLLLGVKGDAKEELFRMGAKALLGASYILSIVIPGSILGRDNSDSVFAFLIQLGVLLFLSMSTQIRRQTRRSMIRKAMVDKAKNVDPLETTPTRP